MINRASNLFRALSGLRNELPTIKDQILPAHKMSFTITIVRHAETEFNVKNLVHSYSSGSITERGVKQAEALGINLANEKFTKVFSSDMERTQETAKAIFSKMNHPVPDVVLDQKLRERSFGDWEGRSNQELMESAKVLGMQFLFTMAPPGGETHQETMDRVVQFFQDLCTSCDNSLGHENVLVVTHGIWIIYFLLHLHSTKQETFDIMGLDGYALNMENLLKNGPGNTCKTKLTIHKANNNENVKRKIEIGTLLDTTHLSEIE